MFGEILFGGIEAGIYDLEFEVNEFFRKRMEKNRAEKKRAQEYKDHFNLEKFTPPSDLVCDEDGNLQQTEAYSDYDKDFADMKSPFVQDAPEMTKDDIENFISDASNNIKNIDNDIDDDDIRDASLVTLFVANRISSSQLFDNLNPNQNDAIEEVNSIYKFLTGHKLLQSSDCYELSEFMSMDNIYKIMNQINTLIGWPEDDMLFKEITENILRGYRKNEDKEDKEIADPPTVSIIHNSNIIGVDIEDGVAVPQPELTKQATNYIKSKLEKILPTGYQVANISPVVDIADYSTMLNDTGLASVTIQTPEKQQGTFLVDMNTIIGNGYNLIYNCMLPDGRINDLYISIDKHPDIVKKVLTIPGFNFYADNASIVEANEIESEHMYSEVYRFVDFSGMYKNLKNMTESDKQILSNTLMKFINMAWMNLNFESMPRVRFRKFHNVNDFTLVSDKNVRVQNSRFMNYPFGGFAKQYIADAIYDNNTDEMTIDYKNGDVVIKVNKQKVD